MGLCAGGKFPNAFGESPDDFLERYGKLIYTIIHKRCREKRLLITQEREYLWIKLEPEDIFQGIIAHLAKDNYRVFNNYRRINGAQPQTYLARILHRFISAEFKKEIKKHNRELIDDEVISKTHAQNDPLENLINNEQEKLFNEALESAYARLKEKDRLIVELFYGVRGLDKMSAIDIGNLFRMKKKAVYKITERFREFFKKELNKREILDFG
ncbi:MAG: sigma-70 family RNA polymerase sigma factor [bacterium]